MEITKNSGSIRKVSKLFEIPYGILQDRLKGDFEAKNKAVQKLKKMNLNFNN